MLVTEVRRISAEKALKFMHHGAWEDYLRTKICLVRWLLASMFLLKDKFGALVAC